MSPINAEVVMVQQLRESTQVLNVILAVLLGALIAIALIAAAGLYMVWR